jgi:hypothetical protein
MDTIHSFLVNSFTHELSDHLLSHFQINGAVPITHEDLKSTETTIMDALKELITKTFTNENTHEVGSPRAVEDAQAKFNVWYWSGAYHMVPEGFRFPSRNVHVKILWDLWWSGNRAENIGPYKNLASRDVADENDKTYLSRARRVVTAVVEEAERLNITTEQSIRKMNERERDKVFETAFYSLLTRLYPPGTTAEDLDKKRVGDLSYLSIYPSIPKRQKR